MDSKTIGADVDYLASGSGFMLSAEQKAALQSSLIMVKTHYKFTKVRLWGKIFGVKDDYFIIQGSVKDELLDRSTLYRFEYVISFIFVKKLSNFSKFCYLINFAFEL